MACGMHGGMVLLQAAAGCALHGCGECAAVHACVRAMRACPAQGLVQAVGPTLAAKYYLSMPHLKDDALVRGSGG